VSLDSQAFLTCHPSTPCAAIRRFAVQALRGGNTLALTYRLEGDIAALDIPPTSPTQRADGLWQGTCCEAFIRGEGYYEFNFSPSTAWASYHFTAYRQGMAVADIIEPVKIAVLRDADRLELEATINLGGLPLAGEGGLRLALSAVVKAKHGRLSYWAIAHPEARPDFHHPGSFAFELA
jgi:hypothetical protein